MRVRINDKKIVKAVRADAKARGCSEAKAVVLALGVHYSHWSFNPDIMPRKSTMKVMPL